MKLSVSKAKFILDKESLKELFFYIFDKGQQNGRLIEAGVGVDRIDEEWALFLTMQPELRQRINKKDLIKRVDLSKSIQERKKEFANEISNFKHLYSTNKLNSFYSYWIEKNPNDIKMRFEKKDVFDIEERLKRYNFVERNTNGSAKSNTEDALRRFISG